MNARSDLVGATIREARLRDGVSLRSLATELGVSASLLSQIETGKTHASIRTLFALSVRLRFSIDDIVRRTLELEGAEASRRRDAGAPDTDG